MFSVKWSLLAFICSSAARDYFEIKLRFLYLNLNVNQTLEFREFGTKINPWKAQQFRRGRAANNTDWRQLVHQARQEPNQAIQETLQFIQKWAGEPTS